MPEDRFERYTMKEDEKYCPCCGSPFQWVAGVTVIDCTCYIGKQCKECKRCPTHCRCDAW